MRASLLTARFAFLLALVLLVTAGCADDELTGPVEENAAPAADAGPDQRVAVGAIVKLNGTESTDADEDDVLTYVWSLERPDSSEVRFSSASRVAASPTFTPDVPGEYEATLTVSDGEREDTDEVVITAERADQPPVLD